MNASAPALLICAIVHLLISSDRALAQPSSRAAVERILEEWKKREQAIATIRFKVSGQWIIPKGSFSRTMSHLKLDKPVPAEDLAQDQQFKLALDLRKQRIHYEMSEHVLVLDPFQPPRQEAHSVKVTYDGKDHWGESQKGLDARAKDTDSDVSVLRSYDRRQLLESISAEGLKPLLLSVGIIALRGERPDFGKELDPDDFHVHGQAVHAGRPCILVRSYPMKNAIARAFNEFWVDSGRDCAVVKYLEYNNDHPAYEAVINYQRQSKGWFPLNWRAELRGGAGAIDVVWTRRVNELTIDAPDADADYVVVIKPGMTVAEYTSDGKPWRRIDPDKGGRYQVSHDGSWALLKSPGGSTHWVRVGVGIVLGLAFLTCAYFVLKAVQRKRKRTGAPA
jgi:hypothetical protein